MNSPYGRVPVADWEKRVKLDAAAAMISQSEWGTREGATVRSYMDVDKLFTADYRLKEAGSVAGASRRAFVRKVIDPLETVLAKEVINRIAFVDEHEIGPVGAVWLAMTIALELDIELLLLRPWKELVPSRIKGRKPEAGEKFLIFTDVVSTGRTILDALEVLERYNAKCNVAYALVDRDDNPDLLKARSQLLGDAIKIFSWEKSSRLLHLVPGKRAANTET
ncbi:MAG: hypothetical protein M1378_00855 [Bacteroidetes bacterium]|nr:hypothetical protein [Bacteroidota bacterium]